MGRLVADDTCRQKEQCAGTCVHEDGERHLARARGLVKRGSMNDGQTLYSLRVYLSAMCVLGNFFNIRDVNREIFSHLKTK